MYAAAIVATYTLALHNYMTRAGSIARYGNPYGMPARDIAFPILRYAGPAAPNVTEEGPAPTPVPHLLPAPDGRNQQPRRETVNLDSVTLVSASSVRNPLITGVLNAYLATKNLVVTQTALREFLTGNIRSAGPTERVLAAALLARVTVVPDTPSPRFMALRETGSVGANDKIIFGTGDALGIRTVTADARFVRGAMAQGVVPSVALHPPNPFDGR